MAGEAYKKPSRSGVGLLLLSKGKGEPDDDKDEGAPDEDYAQARADCAKTFYEACVKGDWDKAGEELEKFHHLYSDE